MSTMFFLWLISSVFVLQAKPMVDPNSISKVHVVMSNHLDVGFTDFIVNVVNEYFDNYYPMVSELKTNLSASNITFQYLTHSWLLSLYLECPPNAGLHCPTEAQKQSLINNLLLDQTLTIHSFPFNSQNELYDKSLFEYGVWLSTHYIPSLISPSYTAPITLSQRDVPGITRSVIPILRKYNISAISIGCNGQSAPPAIPTAMNNSILGEIFLWKDEQSNTSIITLIHKGKYGGIEIRDGVYIENYDETILFDWNQDNKGPKNSSAYISDLKYIQTLYPNAKVVISTIDNYIQNLLKRPDIIQTLPVITDEIGDSWQYGASADPQKSAKFRIATQLRTQYLNQGKVSLNSNSFNNFSRFLLKNGEHTFGMHMLWNVSRNAWSNEALHKAVNKGNADVMTSIQSWNEQRRFGIDYALEALSISTNANEIELYNDIRKEYQYIDNIMEPDINNANKWNKIVNVSEVFEINNQLQIQFNSTTGSLCKLYDITKSVNYINYTNYGIQYGFASFLYTTRTEQDFDDWYPVQYGWFGPNSSCQHHKGFCKYGLQENANYSKHQNLKSKLIDLYRNVENKNVFMIEMNMGKQQMELQQNYGVASKMYSKFNFTDTENIDIEFILINKNYTRIPENLFLVFNGNVKYENCFVDKLGEEVDINHVLLNGTKHLHVAEIGGAVKCVFNDKKSAILVEGIDTGLVSFVPITNTVKTHNMYGTFPVPLNVSNDLQQGFGFVMFDNNWNTNYPYWSPFDPNEANSTFRFKLRLQ
eukprot:81697_1